MDIGQCPFDIGPPFEKQAGKACPFHRGSCLAAHPWKNTACALQVTDTGE